MSEFECDLLPLVSETKLELGTYTCSYMDHRCGLAYLYQFELFLEVSRLRRGVSGTVSGFAVTSASSKNKVESFHPFGESRLCHSAEQVRKALFTIWVRTLSIQSVKIGMVSGDVELRGTSSSGME